MVVESGLVQEADGHYEREGSLPSLAIPATLQDSLMARLDRLSRAKEIAQLGVTVGREFGYELLQVISALDEATLQQGLRQLVEAEVVYQRGLPPQSRYVFKHARIQDAAYESLLRSKRQQIHQQIAQVLEKRFAEAKETQPELLAHHYTEAGLIEQAIPYWQQAGQRAIERSANAEACFLKAIDIARRQQAKSLELRATVSLSRLWQKQGKKKEARQILAEIYDWFTEGFDTVDLQEAKALLKELT
jgi:predicted ATPase